MPRKRTHAQEMTRLAEAVDNIPPLEPPKNTWTPDTEDPVADAELEAKVADAKDRESSASDHAKDLEIERLRTELEKAQGAALLLQAKMEGVFGDYSKLKPDHPFEVMIHTHEEPSKNFDVPVVHNGDTYWFKRGVPQRVPKFVYDILNEARVQGTTRVVNPETGNPETFTYDMHRHQFSARPLME